MMGYARAGATHPSSGRVRDRIGPGALVVGLIALVGVACSPAGPPAHPFATDPGPRAALLDAPDARGEAWVEETLASLSLREAVGQLVFPWIAGSYAALDDPEFLETLRWVEEDGIGGVAISIGTPHAYVAKLNALQDRADIPLLVTSDFENGGPGMRIAHSYALPTLLPQGGGTSFPPTMAFGAVGDEELVERFAAATAREARAVGVHVIFAPVLDLNSNPENPIINTRAFGEDPDDVSRMGRAFIRGARAGGAMTTAKHFPGHGDTRVDSHLTLPEVTADRERLDRMELVPFAEAVRERVDGVMTAHVSVPGVLGPGAPPATLSPEFMTGILREDMGFEGLLYTDALRMGAITEAYGAGEAAVLAFAAGADVILIPASVPGAVDAMVEAVEEGRISRERLDRSVRRILAEKARAGLHEHRRVSPDAVAATVGSAAHRELAREASARSMTLVRDHDGLLPPDPETTRRILSITWAETTDLIAGREFDAVLQALLPGVAEPVRVGPDTGEGTFATLLDRAAEVDLTLVNVYLPPRAGAGSVALPDDFREFVSILSTRHPAVLVSFGNPYLLTALPEVGSYLVAWGDREISQRAAARALVGAEPIEGRLPISIPPLHERGDGLRRAADPVMAARGELRGDALDEAGLLRHDEDPDPPPDDEPDPAGPGATSLRPVPAPPPAAGASPPAAWLERTTSPLETAPASVGMSESRLQALDTYIRNAITDSVAPGVAIAVGRRGRLVRLRGYGQLDWAEGSPPVTPSSLYDLASLTKVAGTTLGIMALVEEGRLELDDPVIRHLPDFARGDARKEAVTVRDLLLHQSGFPPFRQFFLTLDGEAAVREAIWDLGLDRPPGEAMVYSDIGFMTLAWVIEAVAGEPFAPFLERRIYAPLGMTHTGFNPDTALLARIAPTEIDMERRMRHMHGEVHDENAFTVGGVAGHAGLFGSAEELAVLMQALVAGGSAAPCRHDTGSGTPCALARSAETRIFDPATLEAFTRGSPEGAVAGSSRALGWDTPSGRSSAGDYFSARSWGHTGFTGTSIWVDPELDLWVVLLTNRVNPTRENSRHIAFRRAVHDAVVAAITDREVPRR